MVGRFVRRYCCVHLHVRVVVSQGTKPLIPPAACSQERSTPKLAFLQFNTMALDLVAVTHNLNLAYRCTPVWRGIVSISPHAG